MRKIYQTTEVRLIVVAVSVELSCDASLRARHSHKRATGAIHGQTFADVCSPLDFTSSSSSSQPHPDRPLGKTPDEELSNHKRAAKTLLVWSFGLKTGSTLMTLAMASTHPRLFFRS
jgi:hypothetical protein